MCEKAEDEARETSKQGVTFEVTSGILAGINIEKMERWGREGDTSEEVSKVITYVNG